jgi:hypothetical protein
LEGSEKALEFQGRLAKMVFRNGRAVIYYALGTRFRKSFTERGRDTLVLFGIWKPVSKLELGFEIQTPERKPYLLKFKGGYRLTPKNEIEFQLSTGRGFRQPDLSVTLSRAILQGRGKLFLRGGTDFSKERFIGIGGQLKW